MIGLPPVVPGVQLAVAVIAPPLAPLVATRILGALGALGAVLTGAGAGGAPGATTGAGAAGVTVLDDAEGTLSPMALVAVTVKWYVVPLVRPVTTRLVAPAAAGRSAPTAALAASSTLTE